MSIYRARLRNTSNALSPRVSSEPILLQVPPKYTIMFRRSIIFYQSQHDQRLIMDSKLPVVRRLAN